MFNENKKHRKEKLLDFAKIYTIYFFISVKK